MPLPLSRRVKYHAAQGAKFWLRVLAEIKNRGTRDVCMLVCDGLKGLPDAVNAVWEKIPPATSVQPWCGRGRHTA